MKRVLTAVILVPLVLALLFKAPDWLYSGVIGLIAVIAVHEYFTLAKHYQENIQLHWYLVLVATGLYFLGHALHGIAAFGQDNFGSRFEWWTYYATSNLVLPIVLFALGLLLKDLRSSLPVAAISYLGFVYITVTLGSISLIGHQPSGRVLVFIFLIAVWSGDVFAYYSGRAFGRHKLAPAISPGKTWEGAIASTAGAIAVSMVLFHYLHAIANVLVKLDSLPSQSIMYTDAAMYAPPWWLAAAFGLCVNIAAQLGDLVESALKRGAGVKDSGTLLPGHGGMLDRIDALLLAAPVLWFFYLPLYKAIIHKP